ncbi:MAG TPA: efflux RND transporter periplasmic adaptor subunit [Gemmatimonadaceae bacterium]|nr:efflux RND transporter periplasmic adaptor subunit [Gemmatimonadaceae bacterium]
MRHIFLRSTSLLAAIVALSATACSKPAPVASVPEVTVAPAVDRQITEWDDFTGHFEAIQSVEVRPRVSGFIDHVSFPEGATVQQGSVLLTIDPRPYEAEVSHAEAELEQAKTHESLAKQQLDRANKLVNTQAISREELDSRTSGLAEGSAAVRAAEAALRNAKLNLEWTTVRAPISGRVGRAEITAGNLVQGGSPTASLLTTIVSLDPIFVYFDSDEQAYLKYVGATGAAQGKGHTVQIGLANETGFPHEGTLDFVDNRVDRTAGTMRIRAVLRNPDHQFAPGLFARVRLAGGAQRQATMIQDQAIGTDQDRKFVLVLKSDSTVEYRAIEVGRVVDGLRVVQTGLKPGENIVINGLLRVRPGMKVAPKHAAMLAIK